MENSKIVKSGLWQLVNVGSFVVIQLLFIGILSRYFTRTDWAFIAISNSIIQLSLIIAESGLGTALVYRREITPGHLSATTFFNFVVAFFFAILFFVLAKPIALFYKEDHLQTIVEATGLNFLVRAVGLTSMYILQKQMKFKELCIVEVTSNLVTSILGVYWAMIGWGAWAYIWSYILMAVINAAGYMFYNRKELVLMQKFSKQDIKDLWSYGFGQTLNRFINGYFNNSDGVNFIVAKLIMLDLTGIFDRVYRIMLLPARYLGNVMDRVLFPGMSRFNNDKELLYDAFEKSIKVVALVIFSLTFVLIIYSNEIILILFGKNWAAEALIPLRILFLAMPFRVFQRVAGSILRSQGLVYKSAWIGFLNAIYLIILLVVGSHWGLVGIACSIVLSSMINYFNMLGIIRRTYDKGYNIFYKPILDTLPLLLIIALLVFPVYLLASYQTFFVYSPAIAQYLPMAVSFIFLMVSGIFILRKKPTLLDPQLIKILQRIPVARKLIFASREQNINPER